MRTDSVGSWEDLRWRWRVRKMPVDEQLIDRAQTFGRRGFRVFGSSVQFPPINYPQRPGAASPVPETQ